jgi:putative copper export protein
LIDFIAIGLRAAAFTAVLQAAGVPIFLCLFEQHLDRAARPIGRLACYAAAAGILLTIGHAIVEPARLAGELRGILNPSLQGMLLESSAGTADAIRLLGLIMVAAGWFRPSRFGAATALIGSTLIVASFALTGHTATDDRRWLLSVLLVLHLMIVAFWFGALWPLLVATRRETVAVAAVLIDQFSQFAIRLVPIIFFAGLAIAIVLLPGISSLSRPYGLLLLSKIAGFAILMALAAGNRWRLAPRIGRGDPIALQALRRSVLAEWLLIACIVSVTAAMTGLFSPEH